MSTLVLLSGGLDSAVVLAGVEGERSAIGFDYGQRHKIELTHAKQIADHYRVPFKVIRVPALPKVDDLVFAGRNLVFAALAIAYAQTLGHSCIAVGCNATDWANFPDCRPAFWSALETCAAAYDVRVLTPLLHQSKSDIAKAARKLGVPVGLTWSCYEPRGEKPCGHCLACKTREEALA